MKSILDSTNIAILRELSDGRKPFREIAQNIGVTENTVRTRVARMQEEQLLSVSGYVDPERVEGLEVILVGVKLDTMNLSQKAQELCSLRGVISSAVVTGRYDVFLTVLLTTGFSLLEFYSKEISKVRHIRSVETFVVYQGYNIWVPMLHEALA